MAKRTVRKKVLGFIKLQIRRDRQIRRRPWAPRSASMA